MERELAKKFTCKQAALYMQFNAMMAAASAKRADGEKFWYFAAQTYAGAMGMS